MPTAKTAKCARAETTYTSRKADAHAKTQAMGKKSAYDGSALSRTSYREVRHTELSGCGSWSTG